MVSYFILRLFSIKCHVIDKCVCDWLMQIVDMETGKRVLGVFEDGEVCVRGPSITCGYFHNDAATKHTIDTDGWLHTGTSMFFCSNKNSNNTDNFNKRCSYAI